MSGRDLMALSSSTDRPETIQKIAQGWVLPLPRQTTSPHAVPARAEKGHHGALETTLAHLEPPSPPNVVLSRPLGRLGG